ncbi:MAG: CinA family protein [bacterium]
MTQAMIRRISARLSAALRTRNMRIAIAESCTGGRVAAAIIALPGASDIIDEAYVVYADKAKTRILGIDPLLIENEGVVSVVCAGEMARNLEKLVRCDVAVSVTGYAGPTGGTVKAPVGTVCFGIAYRGGLTTYRERFNGNREAVQKQAVAFILEKTVSVIENA